MLKTRIDFGYLSEGPANAICYLVTTIHVLSDKKNIENLVLTLKGENSRFDNCLPLFNDNALLFVFVVGVKSSADEVAILYVLKCVKLYCL